MTTLVGEGYWCRMCQHRGPFPYVGESGRGPVYECPNPECGYGGVEERFAPVRWALSAFEDPDCSEWSD